MSDENEVSRTVPRRGLPRETPRTGVIIVLGSGDALETLRAPRICTIEQLTLDIGRRPHPTPVPPEQASKVLAIPDATVSGVHARIQRASSGAMFTQPWLWTCPNSRCQNAPWSAIALSKNWTHGTSSIA